MPLDLKAMRDGLRTVLHQRLDPGARAVLLDQIAIIDSAIAQAEAGEVCRWERGLDDSIVTPPGDHEFRSFFTAPAPPFCPHCGRRVEVKS